MQHFGVILPGSCLLWILAGVIPAGATTIDFTTQAANRGGNLTGIPDSPLTIGIATFSGGELRNGEVGLNADMGGVYASEGQFGSGETNPLVISFATPVQGFGILVVNGDDARNYTVSDNSGDSITASLASASASGGSTFSLPANGLSTVTIGSANTDAWDFAIDNVTFTPAIPTPEPESLLLSGAGFGLLAALCRTLRTVQSWRSRANSPRSPAFTSDTAQ